MATTRKYVGFIGSRKAFNAGEKVERLESAPPSDGSPYVQPLFIPAESPITAEEIGKNNSLLNMDREDILRGIIYSEILGRPKARRRGRW